ncbi:transposase [Pectobacterium parmentieri]|uniref:Transposase n=2 Tax=Pectobacterium parmentieri TaxID=1905730 RepID=A0ABS0S4V7_PECPM|nr:transposase [Pectobacterium parmentieri]MBI0495509.1 transposase [Pectobacterium parmentieri]MBI0556866.1 transposase [Pectobacterium parmentieri]MBI0570044.1 transposase [Pectobacterium parmentieri]MBI0574756.1 transposase [Pectobacterium parmentieri]
MTRQQYTPEFKRRAVALLLDSGKSVARMAQELDIKENTLYNWKKRYQDKAGAAFSNTPQLSEQELEIRRLKTKIAELEEDKLILKKAAAFFARESR